MKNKNQIYILLSFHSDSEPFDKIFVNDSLYFVDKNGPFNTANRFDVTTVIKDESEIINCIENIQSKGQLDSLIRFRDKYHKRLGEKMNQMILAEKTENTSRALTIKRKMLRKRWLIVGNISNLIE